MGCEVVRKRVVCTLYECCAGLEILDAIWEHAICIYEWPSLASEASGCRTRAFAFVLYLSILNANCFCTILKGA